ncbi:helix-turn-helix transcriptional regulator [Leptolyngbya cf. ectocarpi LEGE 11479]|uniref:Helix-turn-helix transcriptional regulator n=1 Tax=Leptolyngbya cf. ectocarpi LEGE 11479 TaxID=1828722 RepID=A0A929FC93_LEPEC|nr:helix-turn-helix transcriptional regulator [Leptolyngbya ectocarpi]MBE9069338.1 helix-turn-helix transcriptional regulator [Leptolyngbya cf. ectocarpi LEGE 11479]
MSLAAKLKELRLKKGKSLQKLADEVGASKAHIWDLETGRAKNPSIELLAKLSNSLDTSVTELVGEDPLSQDEKPELVAMYRNLKQLNSNDRETIKIMMERLRSRTKDGE